VNLFDDPPEIGFDPLPAPGSASRTVAVDRLARIAPSVRLFRGGMSGIGWADEAAV
jgi:hypothetical protein